MILLLRPDVLSAAVPGLKQHLRGMSRLIVKGLPKHYTDANIRELFSFVGELTDARVIRTKDGRSRQFGFVGFRTRAAASTARRTIDATYVGTARVSVEHARAVGDDQLPRPWSKYSEGSSRYRDQHGGVGVNGDAETEGKRSEQKHLNTGKTEKTQTASANKLSDPRLDEFVEVARGRRGVPVWADSGLAVKKKSTLVPSRKAGSEGKMLERQHVTFQDSDDEDDALYEDLTRKSKQSFSSTRNKDKDEGNKTALDHSVSDIDYFKSKMVSVEDVGDKESNTYGPNERDERSCDTQDGENKEKRKSNDPAALNRNHGSRSSDESGSSSDPESASDTDGTQNKVNDQSWSIPNVTTPLELRKKKYLSDGVDAAETGRLLLRNLAFSATEEELESAFEPFGTLADVHIVRDGQTGRSKGIGFVQFMIPETAVKALAEMDGSFLSGRILHVLPAKPKPTFNFDNAGIKKSSNLGSSTFKTEKEKELKETARSGQDSVAQHALHLSSDAVAEVAARRHGVSKAELLGTEKGESGIAAVRLAMAEASLQQETRQFLLSQGIDLAKAVQASKELNATTSTAKRKRMSRLAFLVKNLPAGTTRSALDQVFARFGKIGRLVVVPSGLLAVIQYVTASDAKRAYTGLAYTKFHDAPLYLEWLPSTALSGVKQKDTTEERSPVNNSSEAAPKSAKTDGKTLAENDDTDERTSTVYVKNLNFDTRDKELKEHFLNALRKRRKVALSLQSAKVAMKKGKEGKGLEKLSMGFGFLEFASAKDASEAIKIAQSTTLDGHVLTLKLSNRVDESKKKTKRKQSDSRGKPNSKLIVRNVAFEATRKDIRRLFGVFGELKVVRLPKRMDGTHRGFAFVEFISKGEAKAAMEALSSSHLYGRHLVIEYAEEGDDQMRSIAELQEKTASYMSKKRIRRNDGSADATRDDEPNDTEDMELDEELQDALYG